MLTLELLTEANLPEAQAVDRADIPEAFVDTADTLWELTQYGYEHACKGCTFVIRDGGICIGVVLLGEAIPWETDPPEMRVEPFYRLMGFVLDRRWRGQGLGSAVLELAVSRVYEAYGARPIALGVHKDNCGAARFYQRHGFRPTGVWEGADEYYLRYP